MKNMVQSQEGGNSNGQENYAPELQIGHGARAVATISAMQGSVTETGNALDLAISGSGFFQVELPDGNIAYTRDGNFNLSQMG